MCCYLSCHFPFILAKKTPKSCISSNNLSFTFCLFWYRPYFVHTAHSTPLFYMHCSLLHHACGYFIALFQGLLVFDCFPKTGWWQRPGKWEQGWMFHTVALFYLAVSLIFVCRRIQSSYMHEIYTCSWSWQCGIHNYITRRDLNSQAQLLLCPTSIWLVIQFNVNVSWCSCNDPYSSGWTILSGKESTSRCCSSLAFLCIILWKHFCGSFFLATNQYTMTPTM